MPHADTVPPEKIKSLRPFFDQLQNTTTHLDDMLAEFDLSKEETEQLINSEKFATHRKLRIQLLHQQLQIAAQNHARNALQTLANLTDSNHPAIARLAATQILQYAGIHPEKPPTPIPPHAPPKSPAVTPAGHPESAHGTSPQPPEQTENQTPKTEPPPGPNITQLPVTNYQLQTARESPAPSPFRQLAASIRASLNALLLTLLLMKPHLAFSDFRTVLSG